MKTPKDPFALKSLSKFGPNRLIFTLHARLQETQASLLFKTYRIPDKEAIITPKFELSSVVDFEDTAVTKDHMKILLCSIRDTEKFAEPAVEIGAYRGVTSRVLASSTSRNYIVVDPYIGYGGAENDLLKMRERTKSLSNVMHLKMTSGDAYRQSIKQKLSFIFVDAVHDYVNARFDGLAWSNLLVPGGLIAFHDTDSKIFPGVQRFVWELLNKSQNRFRLHYHEKGIVVLEKVQTAED